MLVSFLGAEQNYVEQRMKGKFFDTVPKEVLVHIACYVVNAANVFFEEDKTKMDYAMFCGLVYVMRRQLRKITIADRGNSNEFVAILEHPRAKSRVFVDTTHMDVSKAQLVWAFVACDALEVVQLRLDFVDDPWLRLLGCCCRNVLSVRVCLPACYLTITTKIESGRDCKGIAL